MVPKPIAAAGKDTHMVEIRHLFVDPAAVTFEWGIFKRSKGVKKLADELRIFNKAYHDNNNLERDFLDKSNGPQIIANWFLSKIRQYPMLAGGQYNKIGISQSLSLFITYVSNP